MNATYQTDRRSGQLRPLPATAIATSSQPQESSVRSQAKKVSALSANQLLAVELGLFLLSQLQPTASPKSLPSFLSYATNPFLEQPAWTPKQHKYLHRARLLLGQFQQPGLWHRLIERYITLPDHLQAYDISENRSSFSEKKVGFSRNRIVTLKRLFD